MSDSRESQPHRAPCPPLRYEGFKKRKAERVREGCCWISSLSTMTAGGCCCCFVRLQREILSFYLAAHRYCSSFDDEQR